jgi:hypothetical protein
MYDIHTLLLHSYCSPNSYLKGKLMTILSETPLWEGFGRQMSWHAHLDIKGLAPFAKKEEEVLHELSRELRESFEFLVDDQPFNRLKTEELGKIVPAAGSEILDLLAREDLYGAPLAHWTIKSNHSENSNRSGQFRRAYERLGEVATTLNRPAYIEVERVRQFTFPGLTVKRVGDWQQLPTRPFELTSVEDLGRTFRDSEIHVSFEDMSSVNPKVFEDMFGRVGFRIAYRALRNNKTRIIATAQGFEPDMSFLYGLSIKWIRSMQNAGYIGCAVKLKWEEIIWHRLMNNPEVMPAVAPGSLL